MEEKSVEVSVFRNRKTKYKSLEYNFSFKFIIGDIKITIYKEITKNQVPKKIKPSEKNIRKIIIGKTLFWRVDSSNLFNGYELIYYSRFILKDKKIMEYLVKNLKDSSDCFLNTDEDTDKIEYQVKKILSNEGVS